MKRESVPIVYREPTFTMVNSRMPTNWYSAAYRQMHILWLTSQVQYCESIVLFHSYACLNEEISVVRCWMNITYTMPSLNPNTKTSSLFSAKDIQAGSIHLHWEQRDKLGPVKRVQEDNSIFCPSRDLMRSPRWLVFGERRYFFPFTRPLHIHFQILAWVPLTVCSQHYIIPHNSNRLRSFPI